MAEYIKREDLDFLNDFCIDSGKYVGLRLDDVFNELKRPAVERSRIDKAVEKIENNKSELIEHGKHHAKDVAENAKLVVHGLDMALDIIKGVINE